MICLLCCSCLADFFLHIHRHLKTETWQRPKKNKKNLLSSWLRRHVTQAPSEKHDSRKHIAPRPPSSCLLSLSEREGGGQERRRGRRRRREGGRRRRREGGRADEKEGWQEAVRGGARGSGREWTHMWQDHAALLVGREKYTNFKFKSHCDGQTGAMSSEIKYSLSETRVKVK